MAPIRASRVPAAMAAVLALVTQTIAVAQTTEPNGLVVPQPLSADLPYEFTAGSLTLNQLFVSRGEQIDWQADALTTPAVFSPQCAFTGTLVLRGGGCKVDFGWYNADGSGMPPPDAQIYTLVPLTDPIFNNTFQPQVGATGQTFTAADIQNNPSYAGGLIGFAVKANPSSACTQTHFSEQALNVLCTNCSPPDHWITTLIYKSTVAPNAYYLAFEDLPMSPTDFAGFPGQQYTNDGDFNDFVYYLTGIDCAGAGEPCDTGLLGACKNGLTNCTGSSIGCQPQTAPSDEICDGFDNDCDGVVDDGDLCAQDEVCDKGTCVGKCAGEFSCSAGLVCNPAGYCVDPACIDVTCPEGQACIGGVCKAPCDGVTCPLEQVCSGGKCVDPCAAVTCDAGQVCSKGFCVLDCKCKGCASGEACEQSTGKCVEAGCEDQQCATGMVCVGGTCVDACSGAVCPGGAPCVNGECQPVSPATGSGGSMGSFVGAGGSGAGAGGSPAGGVGGADSKAAPREPGCGCGATGLPARVAPFTPALLLVLMWVRRRRIDKSRRLG